MTDMEPVDMGDEPVNPVALVEISTPPFSSNDPATEGLRMVPIVDDAGVGEDESIRTAGEAAFVNTTGEGGDGGTASTPEDDLNLTAAQWVDEINAAQTQEELDAVLTRYDATGKDFKTVNDAATARQTALDADNA